MRVEPDDYSWSAFPMVAVPVTPAGGLGVPLEGLSGMTTPDYEIMRGLSGATTPDYEVMGDASLLLPTHQDALMGASLTQFVADPGSVVPAPTFVAGDALVGSVVPAPTFVAGDALVGSVVPAPTFVAGDALVGSVVPAPTFVAGDGLGSVVPPPTFTNGQAPVFYW